MADTITRSYRTIDKATWGDGPWQDEPDKVQWTDAATGLPCLAVRSPTGAWCGYAGVAESHPFFKVEYSDGPEDRLEVHGGITYSDLCQDYPDAEDRGVCHIAEPGQPDHVWWFGFDCAHSGDFTPGSAARLRSIAPGSGMGVQHAYETYKDLAYVQAETTRLAAQLAAIGGGNG